MHVVRHTGITGVSSAAGHFPSHAAVLTEASVAECSNRLFLLLLLLHCAAIVGADFKMHSWEHYKLPRGLVVEADWD